ncbi:enoyl-CoA hydratase-related protein [Steroidobacter sp.]|uniref:enoyl-CoA hydratase-related protein n=1 Tax=Steroidobacter sp. TaxID=1978227 RepID=UPI001A37302C|nr:enoyl-CoA hydratase-related protein [Steroidobacter sp.]MBL8265354.1 enoyl-CoA hydratase/isomerase family protein [Steroidobacter sp.]
MSDSGVRCERRGAIYAITIDRPDRRNALNSDVIAAIAAGYEAAHADSQARVIVLSGTGDKAFCAGADLAPGKNFAFDLSKPTIDYADLARLARRATLPTIARVNGACMAGGMGLLGLADLAVAADHAVFGLPEVRIGLFPMQVIALLQPLVPARVLREWCLTGERFDAHTARAAGLVNYVVPAAELDAKVEALANSLIAGSPTAIRRGLYAFQSMEDMSFAQALAFAESQIALAAGTQDAREGLASFNERRAPVWTGR